jgi:hypothetical protein
VTSTFLAEVGRVAIAAVACLLWAYVALALTPPRYHRVLVPAIPVLGVGVVVTLAHWVLLVVPYRIGGPVIASVGLVAALVCAIRSRWRPAVDLRSVALAALLVVSATPGLVLVAGHLRTKPAAGLEFDSANHDSYYFTAVDDWALRHRSTEAPRIGTDTSSPDGPQNYPALAYQSFKRFGDASIQDLPTSLVGGRSSDHWFALTAMWLTLIPGGAYLLFLGFGARRRSAFFAALASSLLVTSSGVLLFTVLNQNGVLVLGVPTALAAVGMFGLVLRAPPGGGAAYVLATTAIVGWIGSAFELTIAVLPLVAAVLVPLVIAAMRARTTASLARRTGTVALAVGVSGVVPIWYAVNGLRTLSGAKAVWPSYFDGIGRTGELAKLMGQQAIEYQPIEPIGHLALRAGLLAVIWVAIALLALIWRPMRWAIPLLAVVSVGYWYAQSRGDTNYIADRTVVIGVVTLGVLAVGGSVVAMLEAVTWQRRAVLVAGSSLLLAAFVISILGARYIVHTTLDYYLPGRRVTAADIEAANWVADRQRVEVATSSYAGQLIMMDLLRDHPDTGWATLFPDYTNERDFDLVGGADVVLTDRGAATTEGTRTIESNGRWKLVAVDPTTSVVSTPWGLSADQHDQGPIPLVGDGGLSSVVVGPACRAVAITLTSRDSKPQHVRIAAGEDPTTAPERSVSVSSAPTTVELPRTADGTLSAQFSAEAGQAMNVDLGRTVTCVPGSTA